MLDFARNQQGQKSVPAAHYALGGELLQLGELVSAWEHFAEGIAHYDPQNYRPQLYLYGLDPGVCCMGYGSWALWYLGYPEQALQRSQDAVTLAYKLSHPHKLAMALVFAGFLQSFRRQGRPAQDLAEGALTLAAEQRFSNWMAWGTIIRGWALAEQGQLEEGVAQMRYGFDTYRATGSRLAQAWFLSLLADGYGAAEQTQEGLTMLNEALSAADKTEELFHQAEIYRRRGKLLLRQDDSNTADAQIYFERAIEIAQKQSAKSLELRASMSLARLLRDTGRRDEACSMLAEIYNWFTEGFDTADLKDAKDLLDQLDA
jgi:predicted ATPase